MWHHVSIPAEVDGFVIPSPAWLPRLVHVLLHSLSLSLPLFLSSLSSLPLSDGLSREGEIFLSSPLFSRSSSPLFIARGRNRFSLSHDLSSSLLLFFLSLSPHPRVSLSLSLSLSRRKFPSRGRFLFLSSSILSLTLSFSSSLSSSPARLTLSVLGFEICHYSLATSFNHPTEKVGKSYGEEGESSRMANALAD